MKTKLLKKLRKKFKIEYIPSRGLYKVSGLMIENFGVRTRFYSSKKQSISNARELLLDYSRWRYEKYSKHIRIR